MTQTSVPFDQNVGRWNRYTTSLKGRVRHALILHQLEQHFPAMGADLRALDAGCGLAEVASALMIKKPRQMVLLDFSANMLMEARKRLTEKHSAAELEPVVFVHGRLEEVASNLPAGFFNLILCHNVLEYVSDPPATLALLADRLAPDGLLSLVAANRYSEAFKLALVKFDFAAARSALAKEESSADLFDQAPKRAFAISELEKMVRGLGLSIVAGYGVRIFTDYLPEQATDTPENERRLLELEKAACAVEACVQAARYFHLICRKQATRGRSESGNPL